MDKDNPWISSFPGNLRVRVIGLGLELRVRVRVRYACVNAVLHT